MKRDTSCTELDRAFHYWRECEDVAMHFNELLIRFRLQALAATAAAGGLVGVITRSDDMIHWETLGAGLLGLSCFWLAAAFIDFFYYHRLLRGAVRELRRIEKQSDGMMSLSTRIEETCSQCDSLVGRSLFYGTPFLALTLAAAICLHVAGF